MANEGRQTRFRTDDQNRRTNSLAFAKDDCYTCANLMLKCDRQRPQCGTCQQNGQKCGGFAIDLKWTHKRTPGRRNRSPESPADGIVSGEKPQIFKFVKGRAKKKRPAKPQKQGEYSGFNHQWRVSGITSEETTSELSTTTTWDENSIDAFDLHADPDESQYQLDSYPIRTFRYVEGASPTGTTSDDRGSSSSPSERNQDDVHGFEVLVASEAMQSGGEKFVHHLTDRGYQDLMLPSVLYNNVADKYHDVLDLYNRDYCVIPLTGDCQSNPFRVDMQRIQESPFLLHAVLALASQHLAKQNNCQTMAAEMHNHWSSAIKLFSSALSKPAHRPIIDTLLILMNFEIAQSASASWGVHLNGARKLLEQSSVLQKVGTDAKFRAQVTMLVWWDVTVAFMSRRQPRLPIKYLQALMACSESSVWSFFTLNGCPMEFVMSMSRLASLASIYEKTLQMEWTIFNDLPVIAEISEIQAFVNAEIATVDDIDNSPADYDLNPKRNRYHCIEAWRNAILLYAYQVCLPRKDPGNIRKRAFFARSVFDNIRCIPSSDIIQKQVLLPVFLAASELTSDIDRQFAKQYCEYWSTASRFYHFESASQLLDDIWQAMDNSPESDYWWGNKIKNPDSADTSNSDEAMVTEILLG